MQVWDFLEGVRGHQDSQMRKSYVQQRHYQIQYQCYKWYLKTMCNCSMDNKADNPAIGAEQRAMDVFSILDHEILIRVFGTTEERLRDSLKVS